MSDDVTTAALLIAFAALLLWLNLKSSRSHWTGQLLVVASYGLLLADLAAICYLLFRMIAGAR